MGPPVLKAMMYGVANLKSNIVEGLDVASGYYNCSTISVQFLDYQHVVCHNIHVFSSDIDLEGVFHLNCTVKQYISSSCG
jgi:hypothetical protein